MHTLSSAKHPSPRTIRHADSIFLLQSKAYGRRCTRRPYATCKVQAAFSPAGERRRKLVINPARPTPSNIGMPGSGTADTPRSVNT